MLLLMLAKSIRFLWVYFQIIELCDAASDEGIREILENLPEGLYDTYTRIFQKIAKTGSKTIALKTIMWMVCSRRLLRVEELQEAVAFDAHDKSWNPDKIPDADRMIKSCHGLVVRDIENDIVRLAHHTVQQYLVSAQGRLPNTDLEGFEESTAATARAHFWPELHKFRCDPRSAEVLAGLLCMTYLCFSDFSTAVSRIQDDKKIDLAAAFKDRGPISIPAALGLGKRFSSLPYRFFGGRNNFKMPDIDYSKYIHFGPRDWRPSPDFQKKFALLEYVIEYWPWHTRWLEPSSELRLTTQFWEVVQHGSLVFEFRPWGSNQHFGQYGCRGCPVPEPDELEPKDLPSMGLLHWAAATGHLKAFDIINPPLQKYLEHERYHDETLLIASRHGQVAVVDILLDRGTFDLSDGRAVVAACAFGNALTFDHLIEARKAKPERKGSPNYFDSVGPKALYQAASNGHKDVVEALLATKANPFITDTASGLTPLQIAAKNGHSEVVGAFSTLHPLNVSFGYSMDVPHEVNGMKALHYAAANGFNEIVTLMVLKHGWDCEVQDSLGETPLIKAAKNGHAIVVKTLLEGGAGPFVSGGENYDVTSHLSHLFRLGLNDRVPKTAAKPIPTHHAAAIGHANVIAVLPYSELKCGRQAMSALHLGAAYGHLDVVQTLLSQGADIEVEDFDNMTALHYASFRGHVAVVELLLNKGCRLEAQENLGLTALHVAAYGARTDVIKMLIAHGAAIDVKSFSSGISFDPLGGSTPLHLAAQYADADTIRTLVDCGASLEEKTSSGRTALQEAVRVRTRANVDALIELGAHWLTYQTLLRASTGEDPKIPEILLKKISTSTREEKQFAVSIIEGIPEAHRNVLVDWAKEWKREQKLPRHRRRL